MPVGKPRPGHPSEFFECVRATTYACTIGSPQDRDDITQQVLIEVMGCESVSEVLREAPLRARSRSVDQFRRLKRRSEGTLETRTGDGEVIALEVPVHCRIVERIHARRETGRGLKRMDRLIKSHLADDPKYAWLYRAVCGMCPIRANLPRYEWIKSALCSGAKEDGDKRDSSIVPAVARACHRSEAAIASSLSHFKKVWLALEDAAFCRREIRNLTLHRQGDQEELICAHAGFALRREPQGVEVGPGEGGLREAAELLAALLADCAAKQHAALIGGHTGLWIAAVQALFTAGAPVPALYCFDTRRIRDAGGRFVFQPVGLVSVPVAPPGLIAA